MNTVRIKKLTATATTPTYGSEEAAGCDLYLDASEAVTIPPHTTVLVHTGIAMEIPDCFVGLVYARSSLALKRNLAPANKVGVIDSDYRGEIMVPLYNQGEIEQVLKPQERIAQLIITPYYQAEFVEVEDLSITNRNQGGFGSTGR